MSPAGPSFSGVFERHGSSAFSPDLRPPPGPSLRLVTPRTACRAAGRPAPRAGAPGARSDRARRARDPDSGRPVRRRGRGRRDDGVRDQRVRHLGLPAGVHRARQSRSMVREQPPVVAAPAPGARVGLAGPRACLQLRRLVDEEAARAAGGADLGPRLHVARRVARAAAARRLGDPAGFGGRDGARGRGVPRLARGPVSAVAEHDGAVLRPRGFVLAVRLPRGRPLPRRIRDRAQGLGPEPFDHGPRRERRGLGRRAPRLFGLGGRARYHRDRRAWRARSVCRIRTAPAAGRDRADRARRAPRVRGAGGRDRSLERGAGGRARAARDGGGGRHRARHRDRAAPGAPHARRALRRPGCAVPAARLPPEAGLQGGAPGLRSRRLPAPRSHDHRGALRRHAARAARRRKGSGAARAARERALLRARRIPPARDRPQLRGLRAVKILTLKADGFGALRGEFRFDPERLNLVVDENERGKSTLLAAITAALYGLDVDRRSHRVLTPVDRWRPWGGGSYRLELEIEHEGEHLTIRRDFERGAVEVWTADGQEISERFRTGKDSWPVGQHLFGLNVWEFEKCALVRQGELESVVPQDEKGRRSSTLHARLESAADTSVGDTNASEAVQVLETAAGAYNSAELGSTMKVETAIQRLEAKRSGLQGEVEALEKDFGKLSAPFEKLMRLGEKEDQARAALAKIDNERRETLAAEVRRKLAEHDERRKELDELREEAADLASASQLPSNAEADLRETVARLEEAQRNLDQLEARRDEERAREREQLLAELSSLKAYANCSAEDADKLVAMASEIRRLSEQDSRARNTVFELRDSLAGQGHVPERLQFLSSRFKTLAENKQKLLRGQFDMQLQYQTEVAELEKARTDSTETLREVDAMRNARRSPGWLLMAFGLGATIAGVVLLGLRLQLVVWISLVASGGAVLGTGIWLLRTGAALRESDREAALNRLSDAQRRLNQLRIQRVESERALNETSRALGYRDSIELIRDWNEYVRLSEESTPVMRAQESLSSLEAQRKQVLQEATAVLARAGGGTPDPARLERVAAGIRLQLATHQRLNETEKSWGWVDEEKGTA